MMISIQHATNEAGHDIFHLDNGKVRLRINAGPYTSSVCVDNASHRSRRFGSGRVFAGKPLEALAEAQASYKKAAIKDMIGEAIDHLASR